MPPAGGRWHDALGWAFFFALATAVLAALAGNFFEMLGADVPWPAALGSAFLLPAFFWAARRPLSRLGRVPRSAAISRIFLFSAILRALPVFFVDNLPVAGLAVNQELADSLLAGKGFAASGPAARRELELGLERPFQAGPTAFFPPGAALWGALLGANTALFKAVNVLLGAATSVLIYGLAAEIDSGAAVVSALLWAAYPSSIFATNLFGIEPLFAFCLAGLAWLVSRMQDKGAGTARLAGAGLGAAWCSLLHPPWFTWMAVFSVVWMFVRPKREALRRIAVCGAFLVLGLAPWTLRNWRLFHRFIPASTSEGIALAGKTVLHAPPGAGGDPEWLRLRAEWEAGGEADKSAAGYRIGLHYLAAELRAGPAFLLSAAADDLYRAFGTDADVMLLSAAREFSVTDARFANIVGVLSQSWQTCWLRFDHLYYAGLLLLACWGCVCKGGRRLLERDGVSFLAFYFVIFWALLVALAGLDRYHFALMVPVALLAGQGASALMRYGAR